MSTSNGTLLKVAGALVVLGGAAALWFAYPGEEAARPVVVDPIASSGFGEVDSEPLQDEWEPVEDDEVAPTVRLDAEATPATPPEPLPALDASDAEILSVFRDLSPAESILGALAAENIVRRAVVTVDNLTTGEVALKLRAVGTPQTPFAVTRSSGRMTLGAANYQRYEPYVDFVATLDGAQLAGLFRRYEPLMDEAYAELGYPDRRFADRVVEVIDHLLQVPETAAAPRLSQPNVIYEFANAELESASAGHKLLLRMGPANAEVILQKLAEIRRELVRGTT